MFRTLTVALVAPLLAPLLALSACAKEADVVTADPIAAVRAAPAAAVEAGSARFDMTIALDAPEGAFEITSTGGYRGDRMTMEMDLGAALSGVVGSADGTLPEGFGEPMQVVVDGSAAYLRIPMLEGLLGTTGWLAATPQELGSAGPLGLGAGAIDPGQLLQTLRGVAGDVEEIGRDDVRGVATTHYRATADLSRAIDQLPADRRDRLEAQLGGFDVHLGEVPVEVWVDEDGLARRLLLDFADLAGEQLGAASRATMTLELFDYGDDVAIEIPPPGETTPISDVLGTFGGRR